MGALSGVLIAVVALALSLDAKSAESEVGIVLMHGKWAGPPAPPVQALATALRTRGFKVVTPNMPWRGKRMYDADHRGTPEVAATQIIEWIMSLGY